MKRLKQLALFCLIFLSLFMTQNVISQDDSAQPPRNVRFVRENAGTNDDRLVARWDAPANGNADRYFYRYNRRPSGNDTWEGWSNLDDTTGRSATLPSPAGLTDGQSIDYEIEVLTLYSSSLSEPASARISGVSNKPPPRSRRGKESEDVEIELVLTALPPPKTCVSLSEAGSGIVVSSTFGLDASIQCQQIGAVGIGIASIIEGGFVYAVDIWGNVRHAQVCFLHDSGSFVFLDAATAPRTVTILEAYLNMGLICTEIDRPGSVVLVPSADPVAERTQTEVIDTEVVQAAIVQAEVSQTEILPVERETLSGCWIWTKYVLRLRREPVNGEILTLVPYDIGLNPFAYQNGWFEVEWYGSRGWISGELVRTAGNCG